MSVSGLYNARVASGEIKADAGQAAVVERLEHLAASLREGAGAPARGFLTRLFAPAPRPKGLYIHGGVGRGKTMLMDMFFGEVEGVEKRRMHFHAFMQEVHGLLHRARRNEQDAIAPVALSLAEGARLLCLDEMQIGDIADAMIVGRLFEALLEHGTVMVTTSNVPPAELYRDGLNRALFLPFVRLLGERLDVVAIGGVADYRLGRIKAHESFVTPLGPAADARIEETWRRLTDSERGEAIEIEVMGRRLKVPEAARGCARFGFADLCEAPLGPADYLAIAQGFTTVFIEHIPALKPAQRNEAKRFVNLIDTLYDARVRLVASSARPPEGIYPGADHRVGFARAVSRLKEMQSASWWGKKIAET